MYEIELIIDHEKKKFNRNEPPMLRDMTQALILQKHQVEMYSREGGPTEEDYKRNEKDLAEFAASFWGQFKTEQVINGTPVSSLDAINQAIGDALGVKKDDDDDQDDTGKN
ncbi:phage tail assembly chaperone G [Latilactobacillus curvatus]